MLNIALHEAAHATTVQVLGGMVKYIELSKNSGCTYYIDKNLNRIQKAAISLAGYYAETILMGLDRSLIHSDYDGDLKNLAALKLTQEEYAKAVQISKYIVDVYRKEIYTIMANLLEQPMYTSWEGTIGVLEFKEDISTWN